ncbi:transcriptional regulator, TetR family [Amycolatopsis marina]|uniref:Transcriptional regulator, TetR family n=1 Tax=Amycolatopsis marina TaxID=490629 RepID=A0A1I0YHV5_9PSEU|nr:TetR/AcrR family transcriptional regulator [Amycolatopsis marina]SFB13025.1 transcriptional regulator, TetR family [Amycolatopsis marina]
MATIEAIVRYGYSGATSTRIAEISGFTRGAQKHHFKDKAELVSVALVELQERYQAETIAKLGHTAGKDVRGVLQALWRSQITDLYTAAMELRMAARSDDDLRAVLVPAEQQIGRQQRELLIRLLDDGRHPRQRLLEIGELTLNALRGMASQRFLYPDERRERRQLRALEQTVRTLLTATAEHAGPDGPGDGTPGP